MVYMWFGLVWYGRVKLNFTKPHISYFLDQEERLGEVDAPGLVNFAPALADHFCLILPGAFTQPGASTLADLCTCINN